MQIEHPFTSVFALASLIIAGCATTPTIGGVRPIDADLTKYKSLQIVVDAPAHIRGLAGYDIASAELQKEFTANIAASKEYAIVGTDVRPANALEARLTIMELNYVSSAARASLGIAAGRAVLDVTMTLKDVETAQVVGSTRASHASSHAQGVFSPVTSTQIAAIARMLAVQLTSR